jgi:hypothetical protein
VRHIARSLAAADAGGDPAFSIDGVKTSNVRPLRASKHLSPLLYLPRFA